MADHDEAPANWTVGTNMPGYMPDSDPYGFDDHAGAKASLIDELERDIDALAEEIANGGADSFSEETLEDLQQVIDWAKALPDGHEFGATAGNRHYWLSRA